MATFLATVAGILFWQSQHQPEPPASAELPNQSIGMFENLARMGPEGVPELIWWLEHGSDIERRDAALALMHLRSDGCLAWDALAANLEHPNSEVRESAFCALSVLDRGDFSSLLGTAASFLESENEELRKAAADVLTRIGSTSGYYLLPLLVHPRRETRLMAGRILRDTQSLGEQATQVVAAILEDEQRDQAPPILSEPHSDRASAGTEVEDLHWKISPHERVATPEFDSIALGTLLRRYLGHDASDVRMGAAGLLHSMGPGALPTVLDLFDGTNEEALRYVMHLVSEFQRFDSTILEQCRRVWNRKDLSSPVRFDALGLIIASGEATSDEYRLALGDESPIIAGVVQLLSCDPDLLEHYPAELCSLLERAPEQNRWPVLQIRGKQKSLTDASISSVRKLLEGDDIYAKCWAAQFLSRVSVDQETSRSVLFDAVVESDLPVLSAISNLLECAPERIPDAVERLRGDLRSGPEARRGRSFLALAALGEAALPALPEIREAIDSETPLEQTRALLAIAGIGRPASPTVDRLIQLLDSAPDDTTADFGMEMRIGLKFDEFLVDSLLRRATKRADLARLSVPQLLIRPMQSQTHEGRVNLILVALERIGSGAAAAAPTIVGRLQELEARPDLPPFGHRDGWRKRRCAILQSLARVAPTDNNVTTMLQARLQDSYPEMRLWSAILLLERNESIDDSIRVLGSLLGRLGPDRFARVPVNFGSRPSEIAAECLGLVGFEATRVMESLAGAARQNHDDALQLAALRSIRAIIADTRKTGRFAEFDWISYVEPILCDVLRDEQIAAKPAALDALELLVPLGDSSRQQLQRGARDWHNALPDRNVEIRLSWENLNPSIGVSAFAPRRPSIRERMLKLLDESPTP